MPRPRTLRETLRAELKRQRVSVNELARRLDPSAPKRYRRPIRKYLSGETRSLQLQTAKRLDKALGTVNLFAEHVTREPSRGTRAALEESIRAYERRIAALERRLRKLEKGS